MSPSMSDGVCVTSWFLCNVGSWLVLDGEAIAYERVYAEVHRGLCRVIVA